jgi:hypothetical protein
MLRSPTSLPLSPLGMYSSSMKGFKIEDASGGSGSASGLLPDISPSGHAPLMKDLPFDARFLAEAWSQESPQSVYALLGQSTLPFAGFSPLAASSPGGSRLLSPMGLHTPHNHHNQNYHQNQNQNQHTSHLPHGSFQSQLQSFTSHLQSPLMAMSPLHGTNTNSNHSTHSTHNNSMSTQPSTSGGFYPPSVSIPASPHQLNPHLLSPLFATAISPGGGLGVSADMLSMMDASTVFVPPSSPSAMLRHLLPPIVPRSSPSPSSSVSVAPLNVKELTLNELRPHFNKPMAIVAKELGVCITLMKKICRRNGLVRWPHRRIRSLVNRITSLQVIAGNAQGAERKRFQQQIYSLREELSAVIQNPNEKSRKAQADAKARSPTASGSGSVSGSTTRKRKSVATTSSDEDDDDDDAEGDEEEEQDENRASQAKANTRPTRQHQQTKTKLTPKLKAKPKSKQSRKVTASRAAALPATLDTTAEPIALSEAAVSPATLTTTTRKRSARFRQPPPIKIPRRSEYERASRELEAECGERPSSTTSTGSCGKRGSISSILC